MRQPSIALVLLTLILTQLAGCARQAEARPPEPHQFHDPGIGYNIVINEFNPTLQLSEAHALRYSSKIRNGQVVALHVQASADTTTAAVGQISSSTFFLYCAPLRDSLRPVTTGDFDTDLIAAGYTPWTNPPPGQAVDGWITYIVPTVRNPDYCVLKYFRYDPPNPDNPHFQTSFSQSFLLNWTV